MEHPVAGDFRDVSAALKMITDLERIADRAADISEISLQFGKEEFIKEPEHIEMMAKIVSGMVKTALRVTSTEISFSRKGWINATTAWTNCSRRLKAISSNS